MSVVSLRPKLMSTLFFEPIKPQGVWEFPDSQSWEDFKGSPPWWIFLILTLAQNSWESLLETHGKEFNQEYFSPDGQGVPFLVKLGD